ncbi:olfactory receptor 8B12-like [Stegastes partitus]|uniref:Olfactory receptor 8B12-like n=1 Tax=Stegastes partitus TaxID=144197 RepID=A0A9Y4JLH1_9TELE|nr:PREDICTED: olfactory receptor 8B12-like [Stegastes partitus]
MADNASFYIIGFQNFPSISFYFIFLAFVYAVTVLFNSVVICVIAFNHCLHTPKFLAVLNLAVIDVILNTCTIPSMIKVFLVKDNFIPFNLCLVQMFIYYAFATLEAINPDQRVLSLSLASCIPPCINPIVYSLKTKEIKIRLLKIVKNFTCITLSSNLFKLALLILAEHVLQTAMPLSSNATEKNIHTGEDMRAPVSSQVSQVCILRTR